MHSMLSSRKISKTSVPKLPEEQKEDCKVDHSRLVNNETTSPDLLLYFSETEDKYIYAHHCILKVRCPQMLEGSVKKKRGHVVYLSKTKKSISGHIAALERVLVYLYCGQVDFTTYTPTLAIDVIHIASTYTIPHLLELNIQYLQNTMSMENIYGVLTYAATLEMEEVKKLCFTFAIQNISFFTSKNAKTIGFDLFQEATEVLAQHYSTEVLGLPYRTETEVLAPNGCVKEVSYGEMRNVGNQDPIVEHFKILYNSRNDSGDFTLMVLGKPVKIHKCILLAHSTPLDELLNSSTDGVGKLDDNKFPRMGPEAFQEMLRFFYFNQETLDILYVCQLVEFAKEFQLIKLLRCLERNISASPITIQSAPYVLEITFTQLEENPDLKKQLRDRSLTYVVEHMDTIDFNTFTHMPAVVGATVLILIQKEILRSTDPAIIAALTNATVVTSIMSSDGVRVEKNQIRKNSKSDHRNRRKSVKL